MCKLTVISHLFLTKLKTGYMFMASKRWAWMVCFWVSLSMGNMVGMLRVLADPVVPAIYVFGDSTADVGTNNYLPDCGAKVNFPHHGIDLPGSKPTGRFSNGYNSVDFLAQFLGFKESPPPFLYLLKKNKKSFMRNVLMGANFASGGAGLLSNTGKRPYKRVISIAEQVRQFEKVHQACSKVLNKQAQLRISKSLFIISVGSNDIFEYFLYNQTQTHDGDFITSLLSSYESHLKILLKLGAKRFGIVGVGPIGCCPIIRIQNANEECSETMNAFARRFNLGLEALMKKLSSQGAKPMKYSIAKSYDMTLSVLNDPLSFNFKDGKSACCGSGKLNAEDRCKPDSSLCQDRNALLFWDQFHPSEVAYKLAAIALYGGGDQHIAPMNISQLAILEF